MTEWIKAGVCGRLNHQAQKCKGRIIKLYESNGLDFYLTCVEEGNHSPGNFHQIGDAFDFRYGVGISESSIRQSAGPGFDVVFHQNHVHIEWDPK
jgi:hypothetical protein